MVLREPAGVSWRGLRQSIFAPERFTTSAHFAFSLRMRSANCSGVPMVGSAPSAPNFSLSGGDASAALISALSFMTIALGTPAGATMRATLSDALPGAWGAICAARARRGKKMRGRVPMSPSFYRGF